MGNQIDKNLGFTTPQFQGALNNRPYSDQDRTIFPWNHKERSYSMDEARIPFGNRDNETMGFGSRSGLYSDRSDASLNEISTVTQDLTKSPYYDPNLDFITCLSLVVMAILCTMCVLIPIMTVLLASSQSTSWALWIVGFIVILLVVGGVSFCIYKQQIVREESRMILREQDFARRLARINRGLIDEGEERSWETGPRGAYLQYNKNRSSDSPVVIDSPIVEQDY